MVDSKENYKCDLGAKGLISSLHESGEKGRGRGDVSKGKRGSIPVLH